MYRPFPYYLMLVAFMVSFTLPVSAQQQDDVNQQLVLLTEEINQTLDQIDSLRIKRSIAVSTQEALLDQRLEGVREKLKKEIWQMFEIVVEHESPQKHQVLILEFLKLYSKNLITRIEVLGDRIAKEQLSEHSAESKDRYTVRNKWKIMQERRDQLIEDLLQTTLKRKQFGVQVTNELARAKYMIQERADILSGLIELNRKRLVQYEIELSQSAGDDELSKMLKRKIKETKNDIKDSSKNLVKMANLLDLIGVDVSAYRQITFFASGKLSGDLLEKDVVTGIISQWWTSIYQYLKASIPALLTYALSMIIVMLIFWVLSRLVKRIAQRTLSKSTPKISTLARDVLIGWSSRVTLLIGFLVALSQVGVEVKPLLTGLGIAGFIIGFALQDTLSNFASGLMILIYRPYDVGDYITAAGVEGTVRRMNLVSTTIFTPENHRLMVPNNKVWGDIIRNVTSQKMRRVDMVFGVSYDEDINKVQDLLTKIVTEHELVQTAPEPTICVHNLADSAVEFIARPWVKSEDYWEVYWDLQREIKLRFDQAGVSFPFPQREVHLRQVTEDAK